MSLLAERQGFQAPPDVAAARAAISSRSWETTRPVEEQWHGHLRYLVVTPITKKRGSLIHFHGGGFRLGAPEMDAPFAERLADATGLEVLLPAYRLAPEYPFPAAINDCLDFLEFASARQPLFLSGASAGGGLALTIAVLAAQRGIAVAGLALISPWLDLRLTAPSWDENGAADPLFPLDRARPAVELYLQGAAADNPLASPILADLNGLPTSFVCVGSGESLRDDARALHAANPASTLLEMNDMQHVAVTRDPDGVGAPDTFAALVDFLNQAAA